MIIIPHLCDNFNIYQSIVVSLQSTIGLGEEKKAICFSTFPML